MANGLELIFDSIVRKIEKSEIKPVKKEKYFKEINLLKESYRDMVISEENKPIYDGLNKKGRELASKSQLTDTSKIDLFLKYCSAAIYDFKGNLKPLERFVRVYLITCILYLALSPMYFQILPLLFIIPIFLGIKGVKKRTLNGLILSMTVIPMALLTSIVWIMNAFLTAKDYSTYINSVAQTLNQSYEFARNLTVVFTGLSVVLLVTAIYTLIIGIKYRKMFI